MEPQRRAGAVGSERGLSGGTDGAAAAGAGRELASMGGPEGPVETPVPRREGTPALPGTHTQPPRDDSSISPAAGRDQLPERFWTLLDRLWGVVQPDEAPTRIRVLDVTWPVEEPDGPVRFAESDLGWE